MKKFIVLIIAFILILSLAACKVEVTPAVPTPVIKTQPPAPSELESPTESLATLAPTPSPTPEPSTFTPDTPDSAGSGDVLFDIYESKALVDLDGDGTDEELVFEAGGGKSTMYVNGGANTIDISGLAQLFAVTNVDTSDNLLEVVFTDEYNSELADTEFPYSYLYWWNGSGLIKMGSMMNAKFAGSWRSAFDAAEHFDANGAVYCLAHTTELTDLWYMKKCEPDGSDRKLKEVFYAIDPLFDPAPLEVKPGKACLLLAHGNSDFFESGYYAMWDYASWPHCDGRTINPTEDIVIIAQDGETLDIVRVLGPNWVKLKTADGYEGWIKAIDGKVQGYWQVMHLAAEDIFNGLVIAG